MTGPLSKEVMADAQALIAMASHVYSATGRGTRQVWVPAVLEQRMKTAAAAAELDLVICVQTDDENYQAR